MAELKDAAPKRTLKIKRTCEGLLRNQLVQLNGNAQYELTPDGRAKATQTAYDMERAHKHWKPSF